MFFFKGKDPDGRRSAPSPPENPTSLQNFKERVLTDFGGATKMDSNGNLTVFLPIRAFSSEVLLFGDDQR
jgi:hypothetical protein